MLNYNNILFIYIAASNLIKQCKLPHLLAVILCCILCLSIMFEIYSNNDDGYYVSTPNYFIFGYGSLINEESRKLTGITGKAIPVRIHRMKRGWIYKVDKLHHPQLSNTPYTAVGAQMDLNNFDSTVNGVIFPLQYLEIDKYDQREARYQRYQIDYNDIEILNGDNDNKNDDSFVLDKNSIIYVYIVPNEIAISLDPKSKHKRILKQSYIDKFISGCLNVNGFDFALECIETTDGWNAIYENDRHKSSFSKDKISPEIIEKIDHLINIHLPNLKKSNEIIR